MWQTKKKLLTFIVFLIDPGKRLSYCLNTEKQSTQSGELLFWCERGDLNSHVG